jgi:RNA polymerase sigma-70 factor (ECF subfamily)
VAGSKIVSLAKARTRKETPRPGLPPFDDLVRANFDALYRTAARLVGREDADDVVQEAALRAYRHYADVRDAASARAWLFRVLRNTASNTMRSTGRRRESPADVPVEAVIDEAAARGGRPHAQVRQFDARDALTRAFEQLDVNFREVVWLVDGEGMSVAEVCAVLELPQGTVASRLFRGRRKLRGLVQGEGDG